MGLKEDKRSTTLADYSKSARLVQSCIVNVGQHGAVMYCQCWQGLCSHVLSMLANMVQSCSVMLANMVQSCIVNVGQHDAVIYVMLTRMVQSCIVNVGQHGAVVYCEC
ncbi:hypothetical protein RRG08_011511 [Elysia crispata]|uniref:Uncharacterized protein n=1 Tax=Elysia crispata TaxID=231223 RepID=A0AAE1E573_9GAST|nr:hypothetical protein RRG08_011511 [Elysia crispata]